MVTIDEKGDLALQIKFSGGGEHLLRIQKALSLGIEAVGTHRENSGDEDYQNAVWVFSSLLREAMLDQSQTNVA